MISELVPTINQTKISMGVALSELLMERIDDLIYSELLIISFFFSMIMRQVIFHPLLVGIQVVFGLFYVTFVKSQA